MMENPPVTATPHVTLLPAASVARGNVRASETGFNAGRQIPHFPGLELPAPQRAVFVEHYNGLGTPFNSGLGGADLQPRIVPGGTIRLHLDSGAAKTPKPGMHNVEFVSTEVDGVETVNPRIIADGREPGASFCTREIHPGAADHGARQVHNRARHSSAAGLGCTASANTRAVAILSLPIPPPNRSLPQIIQQNLPFTAAPSKVASRPAGRCPYCSLSLPDDTFLVVPNRTMEAGSVRIW